MVSVPTEPTRGGWVPKRPKHEYGVDYEDNADAQYEEE